MKEGAKFKYNLAQKAFLADWVMYLCFGSRCFAAKLSVGPGSHAATRANVRLIGTLCGANKVRR